MMSVLRPYAVVAVLLLLGNLACGSEESSSPGPELPPLEAEGFAPRTPTPALPSGHGGEIAGLRISARGPRRLSVEELERTWEAVGNLEAGSVQIPENLARSLGDPDWMSVTDPNLEPSPLFMKFMVDLGIILCRSLVTSDSTRPLADRILVSPNVDANIRSLILRFWAIDASAPDHADVARLRKVYDEASGATNNPQGGWMAVCIAMTTAPEFLLY